MSKKLRLTHSLYLTLFILSWGLLGCNNIRNPSGFVSVTTTNTSPAKNSLPQVVATTSIICDLADKIAGQTINLTCLIPPNTDPHIYQVKTTDQQAINQAKLILYNGYNLEPNLIKAIKSTQNRAPKVAVAQFAVKKPLYVRVNRQKQADPHVWHDIKNGMKMADVINSFLGQVFPKNANLYKTNTTALKTELAQVEQWIKLRIASIPEGQRQLITAHNSMAYYAKAYGFSVSGSVNNITTATKPSSGRLQALVKGLKKAKVPTIFPEATIESQSINTVAQQAGVKIAARKLYSDALSTPGTEADTYQKMMTANTRTIVEGLGGTYLIFTPKKSQ
ncbi:MAG: zinc ABC transporter substrate-binding protein [Calothrix sp. MO_192.B10]|nr:zinc ABC transporter substrate-binding protein [Calothrix sp. MO_192.B10]